MTQVRIYIYTIVRIKSILKKYEAEGGNAADCVIGNPDGESERELMLELTGLSEVIENAYVDRAPHKICKFVYDLSNAFNQFFIMKPKSLQSRMRIERRAI